MMKWKKLGLVFTLDGQIEWANNSALTPQPIYLNKEIIRVFAGFRDKEGISRIGYVDVDANDPKRVVKVSDTPVLDRGRDGCFDDNGVILGDVVRYGNVLRMYYVGFQLVKRAKFLAFTGLAESSDGGETFQRVSESPVMDRRNGANTIMAIHTAIYVDGKWKIWFAAGDDWQEISGVEYPKYNIWYTESDDGMTFAQQQTLCVDVEGDEYRIGRPSVYLKNDLYYMFYTKGGISGKDYFPGVAISKDGIEWTRQDESLGLELSLNDFDSKHLCYPRLVEVDDKTYGFYNGNNMGAEGFGVAELLQW
jgi:predicted GH43/DUF377 family glycosyl hydrolase